jgi:hypothetical protein
LTRRVASLFSPHHNRSVFAAQYDYEIQHGYRRDCRLRRVSSLSCLYFFSSTLTVSTSANTDTSNSGPIEASNEKGKNKIVPDETMMEDDEDEEDDDEEEEEDDEDMAEVRSCCPFLTMCNLHWLHARDAPNLRCFSLLQEESLEDIDPSVIQPRRTRGVRVDYTSPEALAKAGIKPEDAATDDEQEESYAANDDEMKED